MIASDNRIPALGNDRSVYTFAAPSGGGPVTVAAELRFRRTFQAVMEAKGWHEPDIVMEQAHMTIQVLLTGAVRSGKDTTQHR